MACDAIIFKGLLIYIDEFGYLFGGTLENILNKSHIHGESSNEIEKLCMFNAEQKIVVNDIKRSEISPEKKEQNKFLSGLSSGSTENSCIQLSATELRPIDLLASTKYCPHGMMLKRPLIKASSLSAGVEHLMCLCVNGHVWLLDTSDLLQLSFSKESYITNDNFSKTKDFISKVDCSENFLKIKRQQKSEIDTSNEIISICCTPTENKCINSKIVLNDLAESDLGETQLHQKVSLFTKFDSNCRLFGTAQSLISDDAHINNATIESIKVVPIVVKVTKLNYFQNGCVVQLASGPYFSVTLVQKRHNNFDSTDLKFSNETCSSIDTPPKNVLIPPSKGKQNFSQGKSEKLNDQSENCPSTSEIVDSVSFLSSFSERISSVHHEFDGLNEENGPLHNDTVTEGINSPGPVSNDTFANGLDVAKQFLGRQMSWMAAPTLEATSSGVESMEKR